MGQWEDGRWVGDNALCYVTGAGFSRLYHINTPTGG